MKHDPTSPVSTPARSPASRTFRGRPGSGSTSSGTRVRSSTASSVLIEDDDTISLVELLENLLDHKRAFALVALLATAAALAWAFLSTPIYTVDALVQVEDRKGSALGGALASVAQALEVSSSPVEGEIEILRSRTNVGHAVQALQLQTTVKVDNRFPIFGTFLTRHLARDTHGLAIAPALPGIDTTRWAWGGEQLTLAEFKAPADQLGTPHTLELGANRHWILYDQNGALVLEGQAQERAANANGTYALQIAELSAHPATRFELTPWSSNARVEQIRENLRVSETKRQSGIMRVELPGADPKVAARLVNAIADAYVHQNVRRRAMEAENSLEFLEAQLPALRRQLDAAEQTLNVFRNRHHTIDIPGEITGLLAQSVDVEKTRLELEMRNKEVQARYNSAHPVARALNEQIARVVVQQKGIETQIRSLPTVQQEYLRLSRDVEVNNQLYVSLLNNAQQLRVARAGTVGNVTIVDRAIAPEKPSQPRRALVVAVGLLGGLAGGFLLAQLLAAMRGRVRDPAELEAALGIHVSATVPLSPEQLTVDKRKHSVPFLLAQARPTANAIEALRTLRLNLQLALAETPGGRTILFTSAIPGQGKSFVSSNLAWLIANAGPRVLLIDADLRKSSTGHYFPHDARRGLSDILREKFDPSFFVVPIAESTLSLLPAGPEADNPGELLTAPRLEPVFQWAAANYDVVIVDAPPILPVSDAVVLGHFADVTAFVVRHKRCAQADIADAVQQYQLTGAPITGFVFNGFVPSRVRHGYGARYGYYRGRYGYAGYGDRPGK